MERVQPNRFRKHRKKQVDQGLVRLEFQIDKGLKARFEQMVEELADEYPEPYDERRRKAKARRELFEKGISQQSVQFAGCEARIEALKSELAAVSPKFFKSADDRTIALPESIAVLPDNPLQLKRLLTKEYQRAQQAEIEAREQKRRAEQYQALYDVANEYNERLQKELGENRELLDAI